MASATACPIPASYHHCSSSNYRSKRTHLAFPSTSAHASSLPMPKARLLNPIFGSWSGVRHQGLSAVGTKYAKFEKKRKCRGMVVYASLFGVGAPEALVIGVVALLVFGPKGLAEVARTVGKTLRSFQPTIRELQEVSREFKTSLEREIGLDEDPSSIKSTPQSATSSLSETSQNDVKPNGSPSFEDILRASREQLSKPAASITTEEAEGAATKSSTSEELLKVTEEQLAASDNMQQLEKPSSLEESQAATEIAAGMHPSEKPESKS